MDEKNLTDISQNKEKAALAYLWLVSAYILWKYPRSRFATYHARQALVLAIITTLLWSIPYIGPFLALLAALFMLLGFLHASSGQWWRMPLITSLINSHFDHQTLQPQELQPTDFSSIDLQRPVEIDIQHEEDVVEDEEPKESSEDLTEVEDAENQEE